MFSVTGGNASITYAVYVAGDMLVRMPGSLGCVGMNAEIISNKICGKNQSYTNNITMEVSVHDGKKIGYCN
jgi:hypothetical protein